MSAPSPLLLAHPRLSLITRQPDRELACIQATATHAVPVGSRGEVEEVLGRLLALDAPPTPKTLDLIGHTTADDFHLQLGDWTVDAERPLTRAVFRELADHDVLPRLGVTAVRLLGCRTAGTARARTALATLTDILGVEVYGTRTLVGAVYFDAAGFRPDCDDLLVGSRTPPEHRQPLTRGGQPITPAFDVDAMRPVGLAPGAPRARRLVVAGPAAREIIRMISRNEGISLPGLLANPSYELALPATEPDTFYLAHVLLDAELIRVYPDGLDGPGVLYPIRDPHALRALLADLP